MNSLPQHDEISLKILDAFSEEPALTQRVLADRLGIALGLVNAYVKRLCKKGHVKITTLPRNRIKYIVTPKGFTEKVKLTYQYMDFSARYFRDIRTRVENTYDRMIADGVKTFLLWGDGEIAELCYISTRGIPLRISGVVAEKPMPQGFFGHDIVSPDELQQLEYDAILVSSIDERVLHYLSQAAIHNKEIYHL